MTRYCPYCGRAVPDDARICSYCGKTLGMHEGIRQAPYPGGQKKNDNTLLIVIAVVLIVIIVFVAIGATIYVYVSGMIGGPPHQITPSMYLVPDNTNNILTVVDISQGNLQWKDFIISYDTSYSLTRSDGTEIHRQISSGAWTYMGAAYVEIGDRFTFDDIGTFSIIHRSTGMLIYTWTFT